MSRSCKCLTCLTSSFTNVLVVYSYIRLASFAPARLSTIAQLHDAKKTGSLAIDLIQLDDGWQSAWYVKPVSFSARLLAKIVELTQFGVLNHAAQGRLDTAK